MKKKKKDTIDENNILKFKTFTGPMNEEAVKNLGVNWKNIPTIADLENDRHEAENSYQRQVTLVNHYLSLLNPAPKDYGEGRSKVQPKVVRKQVEWRYAALEEPFLATEDLFTISPVTHEDVATAKQNELVLNKQFRTDINKIKFINKYIRTAMYTGTVILKVGWETEEAVVRQQVEEEYQITDPQELQEYLINEVEKNNVPMEIAQQTMQEFMQTGQPFPATKKVIKNVKKKIKDCPTIEVKDARNCYIDPACDGDFDKVKYIIDRFSTNIAELKKDGRFVNLDLIPIGQENSDRWSDYLQENKDDDTANYADRARKKIDVYEYWGYWDINGDDTLELIRVFYTNDVIIRAEKNPYPDKKMPYIVVKYLDVLNSIYGEPDAALLEDNQYIIGALARGMIDLLGKSAASQRCTVKGALDEVNKTKMKKGEDFEVNPHITDPSQAFFQFGYPRIETSTFQLWNLIASEAEAISGVRPFGTSLGGTAMGSSATEIRSALDATSKRDLNILRRLKTGLEELGKKIMSMNSVFLPDEIILRVTDHKDITIKRDDLAGDYDLRIEVSTPESDNQKASELAFMLQTMGPNEDPNLRKMILAEICDLRNMPQFAEQIRSYQPQPDPLEQQIKQLQVQLLAAQVRNEEAKGKENEADVLLKQAKTETEISKAKLNTSKADSENLGFIKDVLGQKQEEDLEKIMAQQQGNMQQGSNIQPLANPNNLGMNNGILPGVPNVANAVNSANYRSQIPTLEEINQLPTEEELMMMAQQEQNLT